MRYWNHMMTTLDMTGNSDTDFRNRQKILIEGKYTGMRDVLFAYIRKRIGDPQDSEDILQETFTRLLEYRTFLTPHSADRFIYRTAHNLVIDWYRRHAHTEKAKEYFTSCCPRAVLQTDDAVRLDEMLEIEQRCIRKMGKRKGEIYLMYIHQHKTSGEISEILDLSRRTVENHIFAARNIARRALKEAL